MPMGTSWHPGITAQLLTGVVSWLPACLRQHQALEGSLRNIHMSLHPLHTASCSSPHKVGAPRHWRHLFVYVKERNKTTSPNPSTLGCVRDIPVRNFPNAFFQSGKQPQASGERPPAQGRMIWFGAGACSALLGAHSRGALAGTGPLVCRSCAPAGQATLGPVRNALSIQ